MKCNSRVQFITLACSLLLLNLGCKKEAPKVIPTLTTSVTNVTAVSATVTGSIEDDGGSAITIRGVCWNTNPEPTTINLKVSVGLGEGLFSTTITGLLPGSTYYIRSYAVNSIGTGYGNQVSISTPAILPAITTNPLSAITATTATGGGYITNDGGAPITSRGVCWDINQNPTILSAASSASNPEILVLNAKTTDGSGTGSFVSSMTGLNPGTTYYVRAYASNSVGTSYGNQIIGTTLAVLPTVITTAATNITENSITSGGAITYDGGSSIIARGVCWSINQSPTINDNKTLNGTGASSFVSNISGLTPGTTYYIRAYATNSMGTSYGNQISVTTLATVPTISTSEINPSTETTAIGGGEIVSDGGSSITARGICWSTSPNPTILNNRTSDGSGKGSFTSTMTGLSTNILYYIRAYSTNIIGTSYGEVKTVTLYLNSPGPMVNDIDGNMYNSVRIGSQIWMVQNLRVTRYRNGNLIGTTSPISLNISNETNPKYQWVYNGNQSFVAIYGRLYTWFAATDNRQICPEGWRLPSESDLIKLINYLGGESEAVGKIKGTGITYWLNTNLGATNTSGFTALPAGYRWEHGAFSGMGDNSYWWFSLGGWNIVRNSDVLVKGGYVPSLGFSVRCIKE
jgi:uncharacterized protein (TIGR02145 family)